MGTEPELSRPPVVAMIGMATLDYLYVLDDYPKADSVIRAQEHRTVVGGSPAGARSLRRDWGARPGFWRRVGPACMPRS